MLGDGKDAHADIFDIRHENLPGRPQVVSRAGGGDPRLGADLDSVLKSF